MRTIIVEGWRFIPHSYAMVSQYLFLEFLDRPGIRILHRDLPYFFLVPDAAIAALFSEQEKR